MFPGSGNTSGADAPLDVYVPRLDGTGTAISVAALGIPYGSGIIGTPDGDELVLHVHVREDSTQTWADQLHLAASAMLLGEEPVAAIPSVLMQHIAAYDPRDGTAILDTSWYAKSLARDWLGSRRRHMTEELYTTAFPDHQRRRVILSCVREGKVPASVRAYAERTGELALCDEGVALQQAASAGGRGRRREAARIRTLDAEQARRFLAGLPGSTRNVERVEVRNDPGGRMAHYRLCYGGGIVGSWCFIAERQQPPRGRGRRGGGGGELKRVSSLRRV